LNPTVAEISLSALRHNLLEVVRHVRTCTILGVVKANAYGHGATRVAQELIQAGAHRLGVATVPEGVALRQAGITAPLLVLAGVATDEIPLLFEYGLTPVLPDKEAIIEVARLATRRSPPYPVHLKIETGMGRLGLWPEDVRALLKAWPPALHLEGLMTHLASADAGEGEAAETQLASFRQLLDWIKQAGVSMPLAHVAGSAGILRYPSSYFDMVRPGLMLYGYAPGNFHAGRLEPVLTWKTRIVQVKPVPKGHAISYGGTFVAHRATTVAILSVGYADGYSRALSNQGRVLIKGHFAPIVGRVCMDLTMVDVTDVPDVRTGDEAVLIGQQGEARITADDLASQVGTISYEILTQIGPRVERVYKE
jgi:alanine racemase